MRRGRRRARAAPGDAGDRRGHARRDQDRPPGLEVRRAAGAGAATCIARARDAGLDVLGLHVHLGSQILDVAPARFSVDWLAGFAAECALGARLDAGGRQRRRRPRDPVRARTTRRRRSGSSRATIVDRVERAWAVARAAGAAARASSPGAHSSARPASRSTASASSSARARRRRGSPSTAACRTTRARALRARATRALLANRADEPPAGTYTVCGKHCESGDVLDRARALPEPARGDLLAVPGDRRVHARRWPRTTTRCLARRRCSSPAARRG